MNREIFTNVCEDKVLVEQWLREYNQIRPHCSLGYQPPAPEAVETSTSRDCCLTLGVVVELGTGQEGRGFINPVPSPLLSQPPSLGTTWAHNHRGTRHSVLCPPFHDCGLPTTGTIEHVVTEHIQRASVHIAFPSTVSTVFRFCISLSLWI